MALPRQKQREIIFLILFSSNGSKEFDEHIALVMEQLKVTKRDVLLACDKVRLILDVIELIDDKIKCCCDQYDFERIQKAELNIIRIGVYEALYDDTIPYKVAVSEAMRMSKKFSTQESVAFVNAMVDKICASDEDRIRE